MSKLQRDVIDMRYWVFNSAAVILLALPWLNPLGYGPSPVAVQGLVVWVFAILFVKLMATAWLTASHHLHTLKVAWSLAALISAVAGVVQYCGWAAALQPWVNAVDIGQAYANLRQRNQFSTLLAIGMASVVWWQYQPVQEDHNSFGVQVRHWATLSASLLLASAGAASGSRTGFLQLVLLLAMAVVWKRGRWVLVWALIAYFAASVLLPKLAGLDPTQSGILGRLNEPPAVCSSRLTLWSNVLHLIAQKPWTGWGWGELAYAHFITLYDGPRFCEIMGNAHNLPLHLAVTLGVPVSLAFCGGVIWLIWRGKLWAERDATRQMAWSVLAVIGLHSLLEYPLWYGPFQLATVLAIWMLWVTQPLASASATANATSPSPSTSTAPVTRKAPAWHGAALALAMVALSYAAWDYWRISQIYLPAAQRATAYKDNTLQKVQASVLFKDLVKFAELGITPLTTQNAKHINALAKDLLHFSPEAMVVEKLIDSARLLGDEETVRFYALRYQAAYPDAFKAWSEASGKKAN